MQGFTMPRLQFSIRSLLWLTLVAAAYFGGMATQKWLTEQESQEIICVMPPEDAFPTP